MALTSSQPRSDSQPPSPGEHEKQGDELARQGKATEAVAAYKQALFALGDELSPRRASLCAKIGDLSQILGKTRVALNNYMKALAIEPTHARALAGAVAILHAEKDYAAADDLEMHYIDAITDEAAKVETWRANVSMWLDDAKDRRHGVIALEGWLALRPSDPDALVRLAVTLEAMGDIEGAIDACVRLAETFGDARGAEVLVRAAQLAEEKLADQEKALALVLRAVDFDPDRPGLVETAERVLGERKAWARLAEVYEHAIEKSRDRAHQVALAGWLGLLLRDRLSDLARAVKAFSHAVSLEPKNVDLRCLLAAAQASLGDHEGAIATCRDAARLAPRHAKTYRIAHGSFGALSRTDAALQAAFCLETLGEADVDEAMLVETHRPEGLLTVQGVLTSDDWHGGLLYPERDPAMTRVLEILAGAALAGKLETLRLRKKAIAFDPAHRQDLHASTAMMFRALLWATEILAIPVPHVYLQAEVPGHIVPVPTSEPSVVAGRGLGSGHGLKDLAFLWARGLCVFRPEQYLAAFYPSPDDLQSLLSVAAVVVQNKAAALAQGDPALLAAVIERSLTPAGKKELERALAALCDPPRAAETWLVSYELSCCRAGLLCCGDLGTATELTERVAFGWLTTPAEQADDLRAYALSDQYGALRQRLGVSV
jgi:tetratricopeptide (TPR) repeat protein